MGIAGGVGALVSPFPSLLPHTLALCLIILALLTLANLRRIQRTLLRLRGGPRVVVVNTPIYLKD